MLYYGSLIIYDLHEENMLIENILSGFNKIFEGTPKIFEAPGRVNLIGEHTDYNEGFVFPMAIDRYTRVAIKKREDRLLNIYSKCFDQRISLNLDKPDRNNRWSDYVQGVAWAIESEGYKLSGADIYIESDVPLGAGLSSSAAIEVATAIALLNVNGITIDGKMTARICQKAENEFVGMKCGIMDQFIACYGEKDHALLLDCRSLEFKLIPISTKNARIVVCNTMVRHELAASEYNKRRKECEEGVRLIKRIYPNVNSLRDVNKNIFKESESDMPENVRKRCRHIITENDRVMESVEALKKNDMVKFGELLNGSHDSLRDDYEVSCKELDVMVNLARNFNGVYGARVTGGGFGGCTVNLVRAEIDESFVNEIKKLYFKETNLQPDVYMFNPSDGAKEVWF
jgi:galactokinase